MKLTDVGEDELIRKAISLAPRPTAAGYGPGDDCAVVDAGGPELLLLKTDALVEHVHYMSDEQPHRVGWKAIARVVSDFAAMGGRPAEYLVTIALPGSTPVAWVEDLYRGIASCMESYGGSLVGGETTATPDGSAAVISVAGMGRVRKEHVVLRSGGQPGDLLLVTGTLGGSLAGKHLDFKPRIEAAQWLVENFRPHALMDLSDGLAKDLPRLATASGCGFLWNQESIPLTHGSSLENALNDGEDFELLMAVTEKQWESIRKEWPRAFPHLPITAIGSLVPCGDGEMLTGGWEHFPSTNKKAVG